MMKFQNNGMSFSFLPLCYHYVRPEKENDLFPRVMATRIDEFRRQVEYIQKTYQVLSVSEMLAIFANPQEQKLNSFGTMFTFDDGLSDHYTAATILHEYGIKGLFFVPTCFLQDNLPANPTIVHYTLAAFGIQKFLKILSEGVEELHLDAPAQKIVFRSGVDDPWETIQKIKNFIKYELHHVATRKLLIYIYQNLFLKKYPDALKIMHLTKNQIHDMIRMGHSIGVHTRSHLSVAASQLSQEEFQREMIEPKFYLEENFNTPITTFSYPFGEKQDCLQTGDLIERTDVYEAAFTVEEAVSNENTSLFEIGRFQPMSYMTLDDLAEKMKKIVGENKL